MYCFLETPIPSATQPTSPTLWLASVGTYTQKAGDPTPVPRAGERMYVPTRRKRKGEGSGRSGAGSGWYTIKIWRTRRFLLET